VQERLAHDYEKNEATKTSSLSLIEGTKNFTNAIFPESTCFMTFSCGSLRFETGVQNKPTYSFIDIEARKFSETVEEPM